MSNITYDDKQDVASSRYTKSKHGSILSKRTDPESNLKYHLPTTEPREPRRPDRFGASTYRSISWMLGFKEPYSLLLLIICGGALVGFCLARTFMMRPVNVRTRTQPGEWFWYSKPLFKPNIFLHIYLTILGGIFAVFQFIPAIRRKAVIVHRINGYFTLTLVIGGTVCGSIVARHAFGGELNVQSGFYFLGSLIVGAAIMGYINVRHTTRHRKWMLRCVAYLGVPVTTRLTMISARAIITDIGTYYAVWRCDELVYALKNDIPYIRQNYPQCVPADPNVFLGDIHLAVHASTRGDRVNYASTVRLTFGMALWVGMLIHVIAIEYYLRKTDSRNQVRHGFVLGPLTEEEESG